MKEGEDGWGENVVEGRCGNDDIKLNQVEHTK